MNAAANPLLQKLLLSGGGKSRRVWAWLALFLGTLFLLLAVVMWWHFRLALQGKSGADALGSGFFTLSRQITDADMGQPAAVRFTPADIAEIAKAPGVEGVGRLTQAAFPVSVSMGSEMGISTLLFLEAVPDRMLDTLPENWNWSPAQTDVPVIMAREFLRTYNYVFAPTQGMPQLSENAVKAIGFQLTLGNGPGAKQIRGQIAGFSDRITSVLVPQSFLDYMHGQFGIPAPAPARLLVRAQDPANPALVKWLKEHRYEVGGENQRLSTLRQVVNGVSAGMGILAGVLLASGLALFVLIIQLLLAQARESLQLLRQIGYRPKLLASFVEKRFLPQAFGAMIAALLVTLAANYLAAQMLAPGGIYWPQWPAIPVFLVWLFVAVVVWMQVRRSIRSAVGK